MIALVVVIVHKVGDFPFDPIALPVELGSHEDRGYTATHGSVNNYFRDVLTSTPTPICVRLGRPRDPMDTLERQAARDQGRQVRRQCHIYYPRRQVYADPGHHLADMPA